MNFKGWMDVDNMFVDIYDSMAAGVQGAGVVVCFMSQQYQDSANCKLELKFAQQSGMAGEITTAQRSIMDLLENTDGVHHRPP